MKVALSPDRLRAEMFKRGLTTTQLAAHAGISYATLLTVLKTGQATEATKMKVLVALLNQTVVVADPQLLEESA